MLPEIWTFNCWLAVLGFVACLASAAVMNGTTSHLIRAAICLVAIGLLGQALGTALTRWESYFDTLVFGGVLALLIGSRRMPRVFQERYGPTLGWAVAILTGGVGFFGLFTSTP